MTTDDGLSIFGIDIPGIDDAVEFITDEISDALGALIGDAGSALRETIAKITDAIEGLLSFVQRFPSIINESVGNLIDSTINTVGPIVESLAAAARQGINTLVAFADETISSAFAVGQLALTESLQIAGDAFKGVGDSIVSGVSKLVSQIADIVGEIITKLQTGLTALADTFRSAAAIVSDSVVAGFSEVANSLDEVAGGLVEKVFKFNPNDMIRELRLSFENVPEFRQLSESGAAGQTPILAFLAPIGVAAMAFAVPLVLSGIISTALTPFTQMMLQEEQKRWQWQYLPLGEQVAARRRNLISTGRYDDTGARAGFRKDELTLARKLSIIQPPEGTLTQWWFRDLITSDDYETGLFELGWSRPDILKLKEIAFQLPPVQDLITMAVREVFTPDVAEKFGQFEDLPPAFIENAKKVGLSEEWATNYWAAHWGLPSAQLGSAMLHRRIIDEDTLKLLLRSLDVMPFWRDQLVQLSFNPLTRVDVRRMHRVGVLSDDEVFDSYLDLGYSKDNAGRLRDFTIQLTRAATEQVTDAEISLTKTDIQGLFKDGVILRSEAEEFLGSLDIDTDEVGFLLDRIELQLAITQRKSEILLVLARAQSGEYTQSTAVEQLNRLDLTETEFNKSIGKLVLILDKRTKLPTKKEVLSWLKDGVIAEEIARTTLGLMGYREFWVDIYIANGEFPEELTDTESPAAFEGDL